MSAFFCFLNSNHSINNNRTTYIINPNPDEAYAATEAPELGKNENVNTFPGVCGFGESVDVDAITEVWLPKSVKKIARRIFVLSEFQLKGLLLVEKAFDTLFVLVVENVVLSTA